MIPQNLAKKRVQQSLRGHFNASKLQTTSDFRIDDDGLPNTDLKNTKSDIKVKNLSMISPFKSISNISTAETTKRKLPGQSKKRSRSKVFGVESTKSTKKDKRLKIVPNANKTIDIQKKPDSKKQVTKKAPKISDTTKDLVAQILNKRKKAQQPVSRKDIPLATIPSESSSNYSMQTQEILEKHQIKDIELKPTPTAGLSMYEKHQDLLSLQRKLVVPVKYRALTKAVECLDSQLNFLKSRGDGHDWIMLRDIVHSFMKSYGKQFDIKTFRQILTIAPTFYKHKWLMMPKISHSTPQLMISFNQEVNMTSAELKKRVKAFEDVILAHTVEVHAKFIENQENKLTFSNPLMTQIWHPSFDPHSDDCVPDIVLAALETQPSHMSHKSTSILDCLPSAGISPLIQKAISQTAQQSQTYSDLQKKYGISAQTLALIQEKKEKMDKEKQQIDEFSKSEADQRNTQMHQRLQGHLRQVFMMKGKGSMLIDDVIVQVLKSQQGQFQGRSEVKSMITKICEIYPTFLRTNGVGGKTYLKLNQNIPSYEVLEKIKEAFKK